MKLVPFDALVGVYDGAALDTAKDEGGSLALGLEGAEDALALPLAGDNDALPFAGLITAKAPVLPVFLEVGGLAVAAEVATVDLGAILPSPPTLRPLLRTHRLAELLGQDAGRLVRDAQIAGHGQRAVA